MIRHVHRAQRGIGRTYECPNGCRLGIETRETTAELEELASQRPPERSTPWGLVGLLVVMTLLALIGLLSFVFSFDECTSKGGVMVQTMTGYSCVKRQEIP